MARLLWQVRSEREAQQARAQRDDAARARALAEHAASQNAVPPAPTPLPARPFYWRDVAGLVFGLPLLLVVGGWPIAMLIISTFMADHTVLRDNTFVLGWSLYPAWMASSAAVFGLCLPRYLFKTNPPEPRGSIWYLGGILAAMATGVSLFVMHYVVLDPPVQEKANRLWGRYLYTMPITLRSANWGPFTVTFSTPHAELPSMELRDIDLATPVGTVLCVDVTQGWLGGQWANRPRPCRLTPGQHLATRAELMPLAQ